MHSRDVDENPRDSLAIAIIGMSCRLPGATDIYQFWKNLRDGISSIRSFSKEELLAAGVGEDLLEQQNYVRAGAPLHHVQEFDADFFSIPAFEASILDPQHRLLLECAWETLESAGYANKQERGVVGVFAGSSNSQYFLDNVQHHPDIIANAGTEAIALANEKDYLCSRLAYHLDLRGPAVSVQTACSTSLVSVHLACQSLLGGECDMALAGGVSIFGAEPRGYLFHEGGVMSPDGHCRPFNANSNGTVFGDGLGMVLLKPLEKALEDGDHIHAVILGSATNNDGNDKHGFSVPSVSGQAGAISAALDAADVDPASISYVEAHGTGTLFGDLMEVRALMQAYHSTATPTQRCQVGSLKGNVGHLNVASGIASLIKTALALENRHIPTSPHSLEESPHLTTASERFSFSAMGKEWSSAGPRRATVSSFGIGGTNAVVVLQEAPQELVRSSRPEGTLLVFSAKSASALDAFAKRLALHLRTNTDVDMADVAYSLQIGRAHFEHRRYVVCENILEAIEGLCGEPAAESRFFELDALGRRWQQGTEINWAALHAGKVRRRIPLPTYAFERQRFWLESNRSGRLQPASVISEGPAHVDALWKSVTTAKGQRPEASESIALTARDFIDAAEVDKILMRIWKDVFNIPTLAMDDDFFLLGGNSLQATQVVSRVRQSLGVEIPLKVMFEAPTVNRLSQWLKFGAGDAAVADQIKTADRSGPLELSYAQQRLWFLDQFDPGQATYNIAAKVRFHGQLNLEALRRTLDEVVRRHEVLRTVFDTRDGMAVQRILAATETDLEIRDLSQVPISERLDKATGLAQKEALTPFDLARGPLLRAQLLRMAPDDHIVLITMHHIVSDGWSMGVLVREVSLLYDAFVEKRESPLDPLAIQYQDYAHWQRRWLSGERLQQQLAYWRRQLLDAPQLISLPTDRPRLSRQNYHGASVETGVPTAMVQALQALADQSQSTLFMVLCTALTVLLWRHSGRSDICIGTPIANRTRAEIEPMIGFFANTLVLRNRVPALCTFTEMLQQVRTTALDAYAHQDLPFERLVEELRPERVLGHAPLFQVMLVLDNTARSELQLTDLSLSAVPSTVTTTPFDLSVHVTSDSGSLRVALNYSTDLFEHSTIERMAGQFSRLLRAVAVSPSTLVCDLPLLGEAERYRALFEWNATQAPIPEVGGVHALFEAQAARTPHACAAVCGEHSITYQALDVRSNQLAHYLRRLGVKPEHRVGLYVARGLDMVVGLLAILKAGAAYVPLDTAYPAERISNMLDDSQPAAVLTQTSLHSKLPLIDAPVLCLDDRSLASGLATSPLPICTRPSHLAYVIYTSGSTGKPKGVGLPHLALLNLLEWARLAQPKPKRALAFASLSFDASFYEFFTSWHTGGCIYIADEPLRTDVTALGHYIARYRLQAATLPVVVLQALAYAACTEEIDLSSLHEIIATGEALVMTPEIARFLRQEPERRLYNHYGPTETHVVTAYTLGAEDLDLVAPPPIGRPIANSRIYLLDERLQPVPQGTVGSLYIAGDNLARGYLGRAALTADRFIPDPFGPAGSRMYFSGDLARQSDGGRIEFLGRIDHQIKLRGFRIEPGEIEATLLTLPGVESAVVILREDEPGRPQLVAYVTGPAAPNVATLQEGLGQRLPSYMLPTWITHLESLPLTTNGKVDRKALPTPQATSGTHVAPRTQTERRLADLYTQVLDLEEVGIYDSFFELGGHSLLATQLVSRMCQAFDVQMPVRGIFETPCIAQLAVALDKLRHEERRNLLPSITVGQRPHPLPLSFAQQRLWFLHQFQPGSSLYNLPVAVQLEGRLDVMALQQAINAIIARHEALRTTFPSEQGVAYQRIAEHLACPLRVVDLSLLPSQQRQERTQALANEEALESFDLEAGPLVRAQLLQLEEHTHVLLLTMHHIVSDGWSMGIITSELSALYASLSQGMPSTLAPLDIQYADFALWQRLHLQGRVLDEQLTYWRDQLRDSPTLLELPTDHPRPAVQSYKGSYLSFTIDAATSAGLRALGQREGVTLFMTLLATFNILLYRYTQHRDIVIGSPIANRNNPGTQGLIGFFVNTLAMRSHIDPRQRFSELLAQVRELTLDAYANQDLPFEQLVEDLKLPRSLAHSPLFQVMFVLQNTPSGKLLAPDLSLHGVENQGSQLAKFDLTLSVTDGPGELHAAMEYSTDLFEHSTIERMAGQFSRLLRAVTVSPSTLVCDLPLLGEAERYRALFEWNATQAPIPEVGGVHALFEAQAARTPHACAAVCGEHSITYQALDVRSNQLAHYLRRLGVKPEHRVGLYVARGLDMVVGLLAILKAGAAYVPLDTAYPAERISNMLDDSQPAAVLTQTSLHSKLPLIDAPVLCLDDRSLASGLATSPLPICTRPSHLAYVIYTSGSTGKPKGVGLPHLALLNLLEWARLAQPKPKRALAFASLSFDASFYEFFTSWHTGGCIYIADEPLRTDVTALGHYIARYRLQAATLPVVVLQALAYAACTEEIDLSSLHEIIATGEALVMTPEIARFLRQEPERRLYNHYGPTETHVVTAYTLGAEDLDLVAPPPIGRPIANSRIYLLDERLQPVPQGTVGSLYIAGDNLARGYLGRAALTADRFIPDPFGPAGSRMYFSGDLARQSDGGRIEFLGRIDHQIKLRGFRIEPGEIEATLLTLPGVESAVVILREDEPGRPQLVAYVTGPAAPNVATLQEGLGQRLPSYMLPTWITHLESLPLTTNGKVDRKALPTPQATSGTHVAPRTQTERRLADLYTQVLDLEEVGIYDSFFELGGHSLLATQLVSRMCQAFDVQMPVRGIFETPCIAQLAVALDKLRHEERRNLLPSITVGQRPHPLPLSFAQQRLWFLHQFQPGSSLYNLPVAVQLEGRLDVMALQQAINAIIARHEALRTTFPSEQGVAYQRIAEHLACPLRVVDLSLLPSQQRQERTQALANEEALESFDLEAGPLVRAQLLQLEEHTHVLLLTMHHIVSDGWSMGIITSELSALYASLSQGMPSTLAPLDIQYADFALWQRLHLQGRVLDEQLTYWRDQLRDSPTLLELPTDHPRPAVQSYKGSYLSFTIDAATSAGLRALGQREGVTLFMTLLATFNILLYRYTQHRDIVIGSPIANRNNPGTQGLIGFFVNTLAMRSHIDPRQRFSELLAQVRELTLDAYANQDLPFEQLVEDLKLPRSLAHSPLFQVMFVLQNTPSGKLLAPDLSLHGVENQGSQLAKFDLTLSVTDGPGELHAAMEYSTDLFEHSTIERMVGHLQTLLESVARTPEAPVGALTLLTAQEQVLLSRWGHAQPLPETETLLSRFERSSRLHAHRIAVSCDGDVLSYAGLNARANQIAHRLRRVGVGPDVLVGLCIERSTDLVVCLLAILKAGGAYLPLDPSNPPQRRTDILADARPAALLTQSHLLAEMNLQDAGMVVLCVDTDAASFAREPAYDLVSQVDTDQLAYVIYTSGSTGRPKGTPLTHRNVLRLFDATQPWFDFGADDVWTLFHSCAFDFSVWELWGALLYGGRLVVVPYEIARSPAQFHKLVIREGVSILNQTPSVFLQFAATDLAEPAQPLSLRTVILSGEALNRQALASWFERYGHISPQLVNMYGITETTVFVTYAPLVEDVQQSPLSIGHPITDLAVHLLDPAGQSVPVGIAGELHIAGDGLARGYLNRPALTAERFVPDPFGTPGGRLYASGDLARRRPDGSLEYLGRIDHQVKLRGFRIEPGEIEDALLTLLGVENAIVVLREDEPGRPQLAAYVTGPATPDIATLQKGLRQRLPTYMLPTWITHLEALPLTTNGKVDRNALPAPQATSAAYVAPRTETERRLVDLYAQVLGLEKVGIHDSFFELGGHSLLATQLTNRLSQAFDVQMPVRGIFEAPCIAQLAVVLDEAAQ